MVLEEGLIEDCKEILEPKAGRQLLKLSSLNDSLGE
jgi:hypothetical protein